MYLQCLFGLCLLCLLLRLVLPAQAEGAKQVPEVARQGFRSLQRTYLACYILLMGGDWLQGPYVYALYQQYGFGQGDIATLFVTGFLSSAVFGTVFGSLADSFGRRASTLLLCVLYSLSCLTKVSGHFWVLLLGRVLAGISTSLLFSVPESWMISEHSQRGFESSDLVQTFAWGTWFNGVAAILSGLVANLAADHWGVVAPFLLAALVFVLAFLLVLTSWGENRGQPKDQGWLVSLGEGLRVAKGSRDILRIGAIQSLFEGAMYSWVFIWTPALQQTLEPDAVRALPLGWIFAGFMLSVMIGSLLFEGLSRRFSTARLAPFTYLLGAVALFPPIISSHEAVNFFSFLIFEVVCGIHWPLSGTLRSAYIPKESHSAVTSLLRIPLNLIVVLVLLRVSALSISTVFTLCFGLLSACFCLSFNLTPAPQTGAPALARSS